MEKTLALIEKYILYAIIFLLPITVIAISPNPFIVPKLAVLAFGIALILLVRALRIITSGRLDFSVGTYDFPVALFALAYLLSTILRLPNKMEGLLLPGTASIVLGGALLYYLINQLKEGDKRIASLILVFSSAIFSLLTLLAFSGLFTKIPQLPAFIRAKGFTPEGGFLPSAIFLGTLLSLAIGLAISEKKNTIKGFLAGACVVMVLGLGLSVYNIIPGRPYSPRFPSMGVSWSIAVDSLKDSPILGVGPGNYLTAFNRFRPISFNTSDLWAVKFATASNYYLTILTETGMLGFAAIVLLLLSLYKTARQDIKERKIVHWGFAASANLISLIILAILLGLAPATTLLITLLFMLLALNSKAKHTQLNLTAQGVHSEAAQGISAQTTQAVASRFPALLITVPVIALVALFLFQASRVLLAEYRFKKALDYLIANDAVKTYDTMREAIKLNPRVDRYHATFTRVNLALANAIAQKAAGPEPAEGQAQQPGQISDTDRQNITTLIQQAIAEGKATVALNPLRAGNWEILGQTYRAIIPLAQGADAFAVQTYRQAVALDPINPNLRIALGGIYYARNDFENAVKVFELAAAAKPDHANAHYNLAFALRENKDLNRAAAELTLVLSLIQDKEGQDYQVAKKAFEDVQAKVKAEAPAGKELNPPQPGQEPVIQPPVELPEGSEPPAAPALPSPTPTVSPTPVTSEGEVSPTPTNIP